MALGKISVDLDELLGGDDFDVREAIIQRAVAEISQQVTGEVREEIKESVRRQVGEHIDAKLEELFVMSLRPTDSWGNPREGGQCKTLAEMVLESAREYLDQKVNGDGKAERYASRKPLKTRAQWIVSQAVDGFVRGEFEAEMKKAKGEFQSQISGKLSQAFRQAIADCAKL